jgi:hypothetical protein
MQISNIVRALAVALPTLYVATLLSGCGCGFDCNNGNNNDNGPAILTLGLSDAIPEDLKQVVVEVDSITFRRSGAEDVVVDTFTVEDSSSAQDSFQIDLLQYRGQNQLTVIEDLELDQGTYTQLVISVIDGDINSSYAQESDDSLKEINVTSGTLSVPGMVLSAGEQQYTVEFSLAQSLQYQSSSDSYLLSAEGVRVEDNATAAGLAGRVDSSLFDTESPCDEKSDPEVGNRIYLYEGVGLGDARLADVFTSNSSTTAPDGAQAPYAVASLVKDTFSGGWQYGFGFLPAGDYTMAFSCDTESDDAVEFDDLVVPLPSAQLYEINLSEGENSVCDLEDGASCD